VKKISIIFLLVIIHMSFLNSQTLFFEENFGYSLGVLTSVSADWTESPTGSVDIEVITGNLTFTDYPSSGTGNKINLNGGATRSGVNRSFTTQSTDGTTAYCSFLLNVTSTGDMDINTSDGDYFFNFQNQGLTVTRANISVRQGANSTKYSIGVQKSSLSSLSWHSSELDVGTTYLIVVAYSFIAGSGNDEVKLWVNPSLSGGEPSADINITSGTDVSDLGYTQLRQRTSSGDMDIDGIRVSNSWTLAPLPVELSSFSAIRIEGGVELNWKTETEVNNYGFEIERNYSEESRRELGWEKIGFVEGHGNSNSIKEYQYIDRNALSGTYSYCLKQIDNDGSFSYSKTVQITIDALMNYELSQNYPNPFNPYTSITFTLPVEGIVKIDLFNILGQKMQNIINEVKTEGVHTVIFDSKQLNSGVYFYKLDVNGYTRVMKMNLLK